MNEVTIFGTVHSEKSVSAVVTNEYMEFLKSNLGEKIIITLTVCTVKGTILQETYYRKVVLPCLQKGFKATGDDMTLNETHERIIPMCPVTADRDPELQLTKTQWSGLIDWAIRLCAEQFQISVPEPGSDC